MELTLPSKEDLWIKKYKMNVTDLAILTGAFVNDFNDDNPQERMGSYWTKMGLSYKIKCVSFDGKISDTCAFSRNRVIRLVLELSSEILDELSIDKSKRNRLIEVGNYYQYAPLEYMQEKLEKCYKLGLLSTTGKYVYFDKTKYDEYMEEFNPVRYKEYVYEGEKYIRVKANSMFDSFVLSNGVRYTNEDYVWIKSSPVLWLVDFKNNRLIAKNGLLSGIRFESCFKEYDNDFSRTEMKQYLDNYMFYDIYDTLPLNIKRIDNLIILSRIKNQ